MRIIYILTALSICLTLISCASMHHSSKNHAKDMHSMVVCSHPAAAKAGIEILKAGGNAYDAAITTQFALAVVYPRAGNIGGGGLMTGRDASGKMLALDFREKAPLSATTDMYLDASGKVVPDKSLLGIFAAGVPGVVDGMWTLHKEKGTLPWHLLIQPAINLAENGVILTKNEAAHMNEYAALIDSVSGFKTAFGVKKWAPGDLFIQKDMAATLRDIRDYGRDGFYKGRVAVDIINTSNECQGLITQKDLDSYRSVWREPIVSTYKGFELCLMPPPSSGGVLIAQILEAMEMLHLSEKGHNTAPYIHGLTEINRRAYADRSEYLGDPDFVDNHIRTLLSEKYIREKYGNIDMNKATPSKKIKAGHVDKIESFETTHFSIVDAKGNAVAITTTLNGNYGSKLVVKGAGFLLNNEMDDFSVKPGTPNQFGLVGGYANSIQPGKRMLSSMSPTIVSKDGRLYAVIGTPGGSTIITANLQTIVNLIDFGMTMEEAVLAPKMHSQWLPDEIYLERGKFSREIISQLKTMGHVVKEVSALGKLDCIKVLPDNSLQGGTDPAKGDGTIEGF
ncbi:MAG TPA: gamma-glutamyltransferase [Saprospiraceae bacterium]|nr:gamma-glutamyltransferase [Saprospiraceae bacterium]